MNDAVMNVTTPAVLVNTTEPWSIPGAVFHGDVLLIIVYLAATLIGLPGNTLAVFYFSRPSVKRDLASCLYIAVSVTDVALALTQLPVLISLMVQRQPVLFDYQVICVAWRLLFKSLQRFSVFLVLLLSISRTVSLVSPLAVVNKTAVLGSMYGYVGYMVLETVVLGRREGYSYDATGVYCFENGHIDTSLLNHALFVFSLGVPAILIFISFILSILAIRRSVSDSHVLACDGSSSTGDSIKKHATHTIMVFTFTYMVCNLPHFFNMFLWIIAMHGICSGSGCYPGPLYQHAFMYWFSWNISEVLTVIVNSACNPIIYYFRISQYRQWVTKRQFWRAIFDMRRRFL